MHLLRLALTLAPLRAPPPLLALSPAEQYAQQQAQMRERRQQRIEAEADGGGGGSAEETERLSAFRADAAAFAERHGSHAAVFDRDLYPAAEYDQRNGISRKDGYWAFVGRGEEPPLGFTYGEFPLPLFTKLVDRASEVCGFGDARR